MKIIILMITLLSVVVFLNTLLNIWHTKRIVGLLTTTINKRQELEIGWKAPAFVTRDINRNKITLETFSKTQTLLIFTTPYCYYCKEMMPLIKTVAVKLNKTNNTNTYYVIDAKQRVAKDVSIQLGLGDKVLVGSRSETDLITYYNPTGFSPYFCYLDSAGAVLARGKVKVEDFMALVNNNIPSVDI